LNDDSYADLDQVVEAKGWLRTFRDLDWIEKIVDEAIDENPKLAKKFIKTKSQKTLDTLLQVKSFLLL